VRCYFIDGQEARGEDYAAAIDSVAEAPADDPAWVHVEAPGVGGLVIGNGLDGLSVEDRRADGSAWTKYELTKQQAKDLVAALLDGSTDWRAETGWELTELATRDANRRMFWIVLSGLGLGGVVWLLLRVLGE